MNLNDLACMNAHVVSRLYRLLLAAWLVYAIPANAQQRPLFRDASRPMTTRVNDLP